MSGDKETPVAEPEKSTQDKTEALRMWSAISFALIILGLGIPLWWKTTEVYRVSLPYTEIDELQHREHRFNVDIFVYTEYPSRTNKRMTELNVAFLSSKLFDVNVFPEKLDIDLGTISELEENEVKNPSPVGSFRIIETAQLHTRDIVLGNYRALYFHPDVNTETIVEVVNKWVLREDYIADIIGSIEQPGSRNGQGRRLKSQPCDDIVFTVVNPEPDRVKISFDAETAIARVVSPLVEQLRPLIKSHVKSQWLYFVDIGLESKRNPDNIGSVISSDRIPHIISPLEKKLGSGVSRCPCLHFVLYTPRCSESPLYFASADGKMESAVVSPKWGGIQIHNPSKENCINNTRMTLDISEIATVFVSHLRYLLDLRYQPLSGVKLLTLTNSTLREWELDSLYRAGTLEQLVSARLTLQSLSRLLGEISNIVINEEVGDAITTCLTCISQTLRLMSDGSLVYALGFANFAYNTAETAFSHPSLLALLYFPDDQKYAVYIPLFLPVMIPVVLSLKNIWKWISSKQTNEQ